MAKTIFTLGSNIRRARQAAGQSQRKLAHSIGYHGRDAGAYISRIEANKQIPRLPNLYRIAEALGVPLEVITKRK